MAARFREISGEEIQKLAEKAVNKNTTKNYQDVVGVFQNDPMTAQICSEITLVFYPKWQSTQFNYHYQCPVPQHEKTVNREEGTWHSVKRKPVKDVKREKRIIWNNIKK